MPQEVKSKAEEFFVVSPKAISFIGINLLATSAEEFIKHPILFYGSYIFNFLFGLASIDYGLKHLYEFDEFILVFSVLNQVILALWKIATFWRKRQQVFKLIQNILRWNKKVEEPDELEIMNRMGKRNNYICKLYYITVGISTTSGILRPFLKYLLKSLYGLESELEVPHEVSTFWNTSTTLGYLAVILWDFIMANFVFNASVAIETLFLWFVANILIRYAILKQRFTRAMQQNPRKLTYTFFKKNVKLHCDILNMAEELNSIYGVIIFLKSLISCTQICFLAVCLIRNNTDMVSRCYPLAFITAVSIQLILYCYSGQLIKEQNYKLSTHIFATINWSQLPVDEQKMLQIFMLRSQKSSQITGIFFDLDLNLYLWFFKTAGSLIAVLQTLDDAI